jgi:hypothetical protein
LIFSEPAGTTNNRRQEYNKILHSKPPCPRLHLVISAPNSNITQVSAFPCVSPCSPVPPVVMIFASARSSSRVQLNPPSPP